MQSLQHSRGRILFEAACAFGIAVSCVGAWMQTYSTAMLPAAAIAALYGLVRACDMFRRGAKVNETVADVEPAMERLAAEPPLEAVAATDKKRKRKAPKPTISATPARRALPEAEPEPVIVAAVEGAEPEPEIVAPVAEPDPEPVLHVVDTASDEPEYVPATPLFEAEPYVRMQRAAFGRKAR